MKDVYRHVRQRARQLEQHPLFTEWLDDPARPADRKLVFAPMMIDFTMGFRDLNRYFITTGPGGDELAQALDAHAAEDATHSQLFMEDWMTLGLDVRLGWSASDVFWWMTSEHTEAGRRADFELTRLVWQNPDPRLRFAIVEAMEVAGQVFFKHTVPIADALAARMKRPLRYFGLHHLDREDGHLQHADERAFFAAPLDAATREQAIALVDAVVDLFDRHFTSWLAMARAVEQRTWSMRAFEEGYRAGLVTRTSVPVDAASVLLDEPRPASASTESLHTQRRALAAQLDASEPFYGWLRRTPFLPAARVMSIQWAVDNWACADFFTMDATYESPASPVERGLNRVSALMASEMRRRHAEWQLLDVDSVTGWEASEGLHHYWLDPMVEEMRAAFADLRRLTFEHPEPALRYWIVKGFVRLNDLVAHALGAAMAGSSFGPRQFPVFADQGGLLHPELPADPEADQAVAALETRDWTEAEQAAVRGIHERLAAQETRRARASWETVRRLGLPTGALPRRSSRGPPRGPSFVGMTIDITATVQRYLQTFNEGDATRRRALLDEVYTDDCRYTDPLAAVQGRDAINGFLGAVREQFPGVVFVLAGKVDAHHDLARFTWQARTESGLEPLAVGFDVLELVGGKIRCVHGFLDRAPGAG